jgi:hypothetical protein
LRLKTYSRMSHGKTAASIRVEGSRTPLVSPINIYSLRIGIRRRLEQGLSQTLRL